MDKTTEFKWEGKTHKIPRLRMLEYKDFVHFQKQLKDEKDLERQIDLCIQMMEVLGCPSEVLDDVCADEYLDCLNALSVAHFGAGEAKNQEAAGAIQKETSGGSSQN